MHTFDDYDHELGGREIEARVHYHWRDYNSLDEPNPDWGAEPAHVEVLAVNALDDQDAPIAIKPSAELGESLLEGHYEELREICTEHGYHNNAGRSPGWYSPPSRSVKKLSIFSLGHFTPRMAASQATNKGMQIKRKLG